MRNYAVAIFALSTGFVLAACASTQEQRTLSSIEREEMSSAMTMQRSEANHFLYVRNQQRAAANRAELRAADARAQSKLRSQSGSD